MKHYLLSGAAIAASLALAAPASAAVFVVDAGANSVSGGSALNTGIALSTGDALSVSSSINDLWSAGPLPRFSDGSGLIGPRLATALDDSGQAPGTAIGADFGTTIQDGYASAFGSLVGRIGGVYQTLGANFAGPAWADGTLELFYWDSNANDNFGTISFDIVSGAVPEPATWAMMILGFAVTGAAMRRKKAQVSFAL